MTPRIIPMNLRERQIHFRLAHGNALIAQCVRWERVE